MTAGLHHGRRGVWRVALVATSVAFATGAFAQAPNGEAPNGCLRCHTCEKPTHENPCLVPCTRQVRQEAAEALAKKHGPDVVILDDLEDRYLPVPFDHKGHAQMAQMTHGCAVCHHYTPEGAEHPACKTCHAINPAREDIRKPSLKGAYHRQCLNCHREWMGETKCGICHQPKARRGEAPPPSPTPDDIIGMIHPPIPEPDTEIYQSRAEGAPGTQVIFRHKEHIHRFGLNCVDCHHEDNCMRCHEAGREHKQRERTLAEHHRPCSACHDVEAKETCDRCHWSEGEPKPPPFDHAQTGWPLNRYHADLSCRACHVPVPFVALDRDCNACHAGWDAESFDHAVTGQALDDVHGALDCDFCHIDRAFAAAPDCTGCHDEDSGVTFPARRPGPLAKPQAVSP